MRLSTILVTKRDGTVEPLDIEKLHRVTMWATENTTGTSASEIEIKSHIQFYNKIKTSNIHETLIKSAADLITPETPNYQYVAGRLISYQLRKQVYGSYKPWHVKHLVGQNIDRGFYDSDLLEKFSDKEWDKINSFIKHDRDERLTYVAMEQMRGKYLVQNRVTGEIFETPQMTYALIAISLFAEYPKEVRLQWAKQYYDAISTHEISLPTPVMAGVRTSQRQFSSCVLIDCDDSLDSINATASSIVKYVSQRAGIGLNVGRIRALGSPIRGGEVHHTGLIPFLKYFESAVNSCNQGGIRKGSATVNFPIWTYEIEDLLVLKNNKGIDENRVRNLDYCVQFNKLMYERLITNSYITLFSPLDVPGLYDAFFQDQDLFKELYEKAERSHIRKKKVKAVELFSQFMQERKDTGRMYIMNVDNANDHSAFIKDKATVYMTNLCVEISLATKPLKSVNDGATLKTIKVNKKNFETFNDNTNGVLFRSQIPELFEFADDDDIDNEYEYYERLVENDDPASIALCTLSAINWGSFKKPEDMERACTLAIRGLDALLTYQEFPVLAGQVSTEKFRPLGVGIINFAYFLAKNNVKYSDDSAIELVDTWAQHWAYYITKASADLAKDFGKCPGFNDTKYSEGLLPVHTYKKEVDEILPHNDKMPWSELAKQIKETGIRNSTVMALMPSECQSLNNKIKLKNGKDIHLDDFIKLHGNIDINKVHEDMMIGQRFSLMKPIELMNSIAYECYYNGPKNMTEIEFDDGNVYRFTADHKLLVNRSNKHIWIMVKDLTINDDIVCVGE